MSLVPNAYYIKKISYCTAPGNDEIGKDDLLRKEIPVRLKAQ